MRAELKPEGKQTKGMRSTKEQKQQDKQILRQSRLLEPSPILTAVCAVKNQAPHAVFLQVFPAPGPSTAL